MFSQLNTHLLKSARYKSPIHDTVEEGPPVSSLKAMWGETNTLSYPEQLYMTVLADLNEQYHFLLKLAPSKLRRDLVAYSEEAKTVMIVQLFRNKLPEEAQARKVEKHSKPIEEVEQNGYVVD